MNEGLMGLERHESSQVESSFIVILLHVWTYSGTKCCVSQEHSATYYLNRNINIQQQKYKKNNNESINS